MAGAVAISWRREGGVRSAMARDKRMTVMVEPEFLDEVKEAARNRRMKMSEWVRWVVENELRLEKERQS